MAESGENQKPIYITVNVDGNVLKALTMVVEDNRHYGERTNVIDSHIATMNARPALPDPGKQPGSRDHRGTVNTDEEKQPMNLDSYCPPPYKKAKANNCDLKEETSLRRNVSWPSTSTSTPDEQKDIETKRYKILSSTQATPVSTTSPDAPYQATSEAKTKLKIVAIKERCSTKQWVRKHKPDYVEMAALLEELTMLQQESELESMLQLAECYLHLGNKKKTNETIEKVKNLIMKLQALQADDIKTLAEKLAENSAHTRAIILFPIACDMFLSSASSPDDAVKRMDECIWKMHLSVKELIAGDVGDERVAKCGINYLKQMYRHLTSIENADPQNRELKRALTLNKIGFIYIKTGKDLKSLEPLLQGVEILQQQFGGKKSMYHVYGHLLNNIGYAHFMLSNITTAENYFLKAIEAYVKANDYASDNEKQEYIERAKRHLNNTHALLKDVNPRSS